jgi:hypothetical protein
VQTIKQEHAAALCAIARNAPINSFLCAYNLSTHVRAHTHLDMIDHTAKLPLELRQAV